MGAKSTRNISRAEALAFINDHLEEIDDQTLAQVVEDINDYLYDKADYENALGLHNFCIDEDTGCD